MGYLYKDPMGAAWQFDSDEDAAAFGPGNLVRMTDEEVAAHLSPAVPTYQSELAALNAEWQLKVDAYNKSFAIAALVDGSSEEVKKAAIRAAYEADKLENTAARAALKLKHGIGG